VTKRFSNTCLTAASIYIEQSAVEILVVSRPEILISVTPLSIIFAPIEYAKLSTTMARTLIAQTYRGGTTREIQDIVFAAFDAKKTSALIHSSANTIPKPILPVTFATCVARTTPLKPSYTVTTPQAQVTTSVLNANSVSVLKTNSTHTLRMTLSAPTARCVRQISTQTLYVRHTGKLATDTASACPVIRTLCLMQSGFNMWRAAHTTSPQMPESVRLRRSKIVAYKDKFNHHYCVKCNIDFFSDKKRTEHLECSNTHHFCISVEQTSLRRTR